MRVFIDSNILVSYLVSDHPHHNRAKTMLTKALNDEATLVVSAQVIGETYAVATSPKRVEHPLELSDFNALIRAFLSDPAVEFVAPGHTALHFALESAYRQQAKSYRIFDLILYGTMREHGISSLATLNRKHFEKLADIQLL